jgi:hypothetical protein
MSIDYIYLNQEMQKNVDLLRQSYQAVMLQECNVSPISHSSCGCEQVNIIKLSSERIVIFFKVRRKHTFSKYDNIYSWIFD